MLNQQLLQQQQKLANINTTKKDKKAQHHQDEYDKFRKTGTYKAYSSMPGIAASTGFTMMLRDKATRDSVLDKVGGATGKTGLAGAATDALGSQGMLPLLGGAGYLGMRGIGTVGRNMRMARDKTYEKELGGVGKAHRGYQNVMQANRLAYTLPLGLSMMGQGAGLTSSTWGGPSIWKGLGAAGMGGMGGMAATAGVGVGLAMMKSFRLAKIQPKKKSPGDLESQYSVSGKYDNYVSQLQAKGQLKPENAIMISLLQQIERHTSVLGAMASHTAYLEEIKTKGVKGAEKEYSNLLQPESKGAISSGLDISEKFLSKGLQKYDPMGQLITFITTGKLPKQALAEIEGIYETDEDHSRELSKEFGISMNNVKLLHLSSSNILRTAQSFEAKQIALLAALLDVAIFDAKTNLTLMVSQGISNQAFNDPSLSEKTTMGQMIKAIPQQIGSAIANIPGINSLINLAKIPLIDLPRMLGKGLTKLSELGEWVSGKEKRQKDKETKGIYSLLQDKDAFDKELGIYQEPSEKAYEFMGNGLPKVLSKIEYILNKQLTIQTSTLEVLEAYTGVQTDKSQLDNVHEMMWDPITQKVISKKQYDDIRKTLKLEYAKDKLGGWNPFSSEDSKEKKTLSRLDKAGLSEGDLYDEQSPMLEKLFHNQKEYNIFKKSEKNQFGAGLGSMAMAPLLPLFALMSYQHGKSSGDKKRGFIDGTIFDLSQDETKQQTSSLISNSQPPLLEIQTDRVVEELTSIKNILSEDQSFSSHQQMSFPSTTSNTKEQENLQKILFMTLMYNQMQKKGQIDMDGNLSGSISQPITKEIVKSVSSGMFDDEGNQLDINDEINRLSPSGPPKNEASAKTQHEAEEKERKEEKKEETQSKIVSTLEGVWGSIKEQTDKLNKADKKDVNKWADYLVLGAAGIFGLMALWKTGIPQKVGSKIMDLVMNNPKLALGGFAGVGALLGFKIGGLGGAVAGGLLGGAIGMVLPMLSKDEEKKAEFYDEIWGKLKDKVAAHPMLTAGTLVGAGALAGLPFGLVGMTVGAAIGGGAGLLIPMLNDKMSDSDKEEFYGEIGDFIKEKAANHPGFVTAGAAIAGSKIGLNIGGKKLKGIARLKLGVLGAAVGGAFGLLAPLFNDKMEGADKVDFYKKMGNWFLESDLIQSLAGSWAGAKLGAIAFAPFFPPVGSMVGFILGGIFGGILPKILKSLFNQSDTEIVNKITKSPHLANVTDVDLNQWGNDRTVRESLAAQNVTEEEMDRLFESRQQDTLNDSRTAAMTNLYYAEKQKLIERLQTDPDFYERFSDKKVAKLRGGLLSRSSPPNWLNLSDEEYNQIKMIFHYSNQDVLTRKKDWTQLHDHIMTKSKEPAQIQNQTFSQHPDINQQLLPHQQSQSLQIISGETPKFATGGTIIPQQYKDYEAIVGERGAEKLIVHEDGTIDIKPMPQETEQQDFKFSEQKIKDGSEVKALRTTQYQNQVISQLQKLGNSQNRLGLDLAISGFKEGSKVNPSTAMYLAHYGFVQGSILGDMESFNELKRIKDPWMEKESRRSGLSNLEKRRQGQDPWAETEDKSIFQMLKDEFNESLSGGMSLVKGKDKDPMSEHPSRTRGNEDYLPEDMGKGFFSDLAAGLSQFGKNTAEVKKRTSKPDENRYSLQQLLKEWNMGFHFFTGNTLVTYPEKKWINIPVSGSAYRSYDGITEQPHILIQTIKSRLNTFLVHRYGKGTTYNPNSIKYGTKQYNGVVFVYAYDISFHDKEKAAAEQPNKNLSETERLHLDRQQETTNPAIQIGKEDSDLPVTGSYPDNDEGYRNPAIQVNKEDSDLPVTGSYPDNDEGYQVPNKEETEKERLSLSTSFPDYDPNNPTWDDIDNQNSNAAVGNVEQSSADGDLVSYQHPLPGGRQTSPFGPRRHPVTGEERRPHKGVDFAGPQSGMTGLPISASADGVVSFAGTQRGYGNIVIVDHPDGKQTAYAHLNDFNVGKGDEISAGDKIGGMGNTGVSTGPHLHFEVRNRGSHEDPMNYISGGSADNDIVAQLGESGTVGYGEGGFLGGLVKQGQNMVNKEINKHVGGGFNLNDPSGMITKGKQIATGAITSQLPDMVDDPTGLVNEGLGIAKNIVGQIVNNSVDSVMNSAKKESDSSVEGLPWLEEGDKKVDGLPWLEEGDKKVDGLSGKSNNDLFGFEKDKIMNQMPSEITGKDGVGDLFSGLFDSFSEQMKQMGTEFINDKAQNVTDKYFEKQETEEKEDDRTMALAHAVGSQQGPPAKGQTPMLPDGTVEVQSSVENVLMGQIDNLFGLSRHQLRQQVVDYAYGRMIYSQRSIA